jgi:hypothetical protein
MFTGVKSNYYMLGFNSNAKFDECDVERNANSQLSSIMKWAQDAGKHTGIVTTTRVTHATPAALYAHSNNRDWECDSSVPPAFKDCIKDIARQLIEDEPAKYVLRDRGCLVRAKVRDSRGASCLDQVTSCVKYSFFKSYELLSQSTNSAYFMLTQKFITVSTTAPLLVPILSFLFKSHINVILPPTPRFPTLSPSFKIPNRISVCIRVPPHTCVHAPPLCSSIIWRL